VAGGQAVIEIRPLIQFEEFAEAVRFAQTIWGFDDIEMLPLRSFRGVRKDRRALFGRLPRR